MSNEQKDYLYDTVAMMVDQWGTQRVLDDMCTMLSEDALHEVLAAISAFHHDSFGIDFWYSNRANYVDREFWESDIV